MAIIRSFSYGSASAVEYSTINELLSQLPDNNANQIVAQDIRDSVYTLWNRIDAVSVVASQSASASVYFTNLTPVPLPVGGIAAGTTFSNASMSDMWNALLYPYIAPSVTLVGGDTREFGSTNVVTLTWYAYKNTDPIISIIVDGVPIGGGPFNSNQSNSQGALATQNVTTTFLMSASDGTSTPSSSTTVYWANKRYWGKTPSFGAFTLSSQILSLSGAGVGSGSVLASSLSAVYNGIDGAGEYLVFAWPTYFGTPSFTVNGLPNTAFTKVNSSFSFTNAWGYVENYDVWMSNTVQNSAISQFVIS